METIMLFVIVFFIFWIIMIRPQRKQERERQRMLQNLKKGDQVLTSGGIIGKVERVKEDRVVLNLDEGGKSKATVLRSAIIGMMNQSDEKDSEKKSHEEKEK